MAGNAIAQWLVSQVTDPWGNKIYFNYAQLDGESWPTSIDYANSSVHFIFEKRADENTFYANGSAVKQTRILKKIKTLSDKNNFREYEFNYIKPANEIYTKLVEVVLKGSDGTQLNSTVVNWNQESESITVVTSQPANLNDAGNFEIITGNFNDDGKTDYIKINKSTGTWTQYNSTGTDFVAGITGDFWSYPNKFYSKYSKTDEYYNRINNLGDIDKDGKDDIILCIQNDQTGFYDVNAYLSKDNYATAKPIIVHNYFACKVDIGNFDGDDMLDIMIYNITSSPYTTSVYIYSFDYKTDNFIHRDFLEHWGFFQVQASTIKCMDFNGNGITDIFLFNNDTKKYKIIEFGYYNINVWKIVNTLLEDTDLPTIVNQSFDSNTFNFQTGDFNGDGKTDLLLLNVGFLSFTHTVTLYGQNFDVTDNFYDYFYYKLTSTNLNFNSSEILQMQGRKLFNENWQLIYDYTKLVSAVGDYNNDGKSDMLCQNQHHFFMLYGSGIQDQTGYSRFISKDFGFFYNLQDHSFKLGDFNGDSNLDILSWHSSWPVSFVSFNYNDKSRFVSKITDGFNKKVMFEYASLANQTGVYSKDLSLNYPLHIMQVPFFVVNELKTTNGNGSGELSTTFTYKNLMSHNQGKGFLGFQEIVMNSPLNITTTTNEVVKNNLTIVDPIYVFRPKTSSVNTLLDATISSKSFTYSSITDNGHKSYFQYVSDIEEANVEHGTVNYSYSYDTKGNITSDKTEFSVTDYVQTTYSSYPSSTVNLYEMKPGTVSVEKNNGGESYTVTSTLTYDHGQLKSKEANGVKIEYTFDQTYGNITKQVATGAEKTITENYTFDGSHRFITTQTNALGTTKLSYNSFGLLQSSTDINNLTTTFTYDGFGFLKSKNFADGNSVTYQKVFSDSDPVRFYVLESPSGLTPVTTY